MPPRCHWATQLRMLGSIGTQRVRQGPKERPGFPVAGSAQFPGPLATRMPPSPPWSCRSVHQEACSCGSAGVASWGAST
eukprot:10401534-Alexandrium_andersonii.AAC.1